MTLMIGADTRHIDKPLTFAGRRAMQTAFADYGLVLLNGIPNRAALAKLARSLACVVPHRDSGPDGVTVLTDHGSSSDGFAGFTTDALSPHTDRSGIPSPPGLLFMSCERAADYGGECVVADGKAIYQHLVHTAPESAQALSAPRSVLFGGPAGYLGSVFQHAENGRTMIRLRQDELARFSPAAARHLSALRQAIAAHTHTFELQSGQGYLLDNHRWLHARRAFSGPRTMHRIHADPIPGTGIRTGFESRAC